jgi:hypothetical protein
MMSGNDSERCMFDGLVRVCLRFGGSLKPAKCTNRQKSEPLGLCEPYTLTQHWSALSPLGTPVAN